MKRLLILIVLVVGCVIPLGAQYVDGIAVHPSATPKEALAFARRSLDWYQINRFSILPQRVIQQPLAYNPPDRLTYLVTVQPRWWGYDSAECVEPAPTSALVPHATIGPPGECTFFLGQFEVRNFQAPDGATPQQLSALRESAMAFYEAHGGAFIATGSSVYPWVVVYQRQLGVCP